MFKFIFKDFTKIESLFFQYLWKKIFSRNNTFFLNKNSKVFKTENGTFWAK